MSAPGPVRFVRFADRPHVCGTDGVDAVSSPSVLERQAARSASNPGRERIFVAATGENGVILGKKHQGRFLRQGGDRVEDYDPHAARALAHEPGLSKLPKLRELQDAIAERRQFAVKRATVMERL
jgi:hypothetical protein